VFCGAFQHGLWCGSKLVSAKSVDVAASAIREISKEEGNNRLAPSSGSGSYFG
jgi:hypothetical protein